MEMPPANLSNPRRYLRGRGPEERTIALEWWAAARIVELVLDVLAFGFPHVSVELQRASVLM